MKLGTIVSHQFSESFKKLMKMSGVPVKTLFILRSLSKQIASHAADYEEIKKQLLDEYAKKDETGKMIIENGNVLIQPEMVKKFMKEFQELSDREIDITKVKFSDLGDLPQLTPEDILFLEFIEE